MAEGGWGGISFDWSCDKFALFIIYNNVGSVFDSYELLVTSYELLVTSYELI